MRPRGRNRLKVGIASLSFAAAVVGASYLGSRQIASPIGNAPQSAVTNAAPANVSQHPDDANAPVRAVRALDEQGSDALSRTAILQAIEADGTDSHTQDESVQPATFTPLGQTTEVTRDRYAHVIDELSGTDQGMGDLTWQINDAVASISVNHLSPDDIRSQEDVIAAMEIFATIKSLVSNGMKYSSRELLRFAHDHATRQDVNRAIAQAYQALKDANSS